MTRDIERILDGFLADGTNELADRVLDAALTDINKTPQRRSWWPTWRFAHMNIYAKTAIAAAAVVVVAIVGYRFLPGSGGIGSDATPTPRPSAEPATGSLDPGVYYLDSAAVTPARFTFEVPAGWTARSDGYIYKHGDQPEELGLNSYGAVTHVYADACHSAGTLTEVGPTVDDLVDALDAQVGTDTPGPVDVTVGGLSGKRVDLTVAAEVDPATCRNAGVIQVWADPSETSFFAFFPNTGPASVYVVDVRGKRVVIVVGHSPASPAADVAELDAIFDSIQFAP